MATKKRPASTGYRYELSEAERATIHCSGPLQVEHMTKVFGLVALALVKRLLTEQHRFRSDEVGSVMKVVRIDGVEFDEIPGLPHEGRLRLRYSLSPYTGFYRVIAKLTSGNGGLSGVITVQTRRRYQLKVRNVHEEK